jgi:MerR family mercuric resistance operon transcriptional regulator
MKIRIRNEAALEAKAEAPKKVPLTIARLGAAAGVGVETVRYYQRRGLLAVPAGGGGVRRYDEEDVRRLRFIRRAQAAGFTLEEISELLALDRTDDRARVRALAGERLAALDARIAELEASRTALERLRSRCASGRKGPCPILDAFDGL